MITGSVEDPADLKEEDLAKLTAYMKMLADKVMEERPNITEAELFEISDELFENAEAFVNQEKMLKRKVPAQKVGTFFIIAIFALKSVLRND